MDEKPKIRTIYRIEGGILNGTEIEPFMFTVLVRYPHRKTPDCYIPPMEANGKKIDTWHCCQDCASPDFKGGIDALLEHLMLHKGRLLKPWSKKSQIKTPIPAVRIPDNPWDKVRNDTSEDRRFCVSLYIDDVKHALRKQGLEILQPPSI